MDPAQDALLRGALPHAKKLTERLLLFLEAQLAKAIKFPQSEVDRQFEAEAVAAGATLRQLTDEEEALVDRLTWRPVAETCIASLLHVICDQAEASAERTTRCTDAEVRALAKAKIEARRLGLSEADTQTAAGLTADLFCDRAQFVEPESLTIDGQQFTIHRDGDTLVVRAL